MNTNQQPAPAPETWGPTFLAALRERQTITAAAQAAGVSLETIFQRQTSDPAFQADFKATLWAARNPSAMRALAAACGYPATLFGFTPDRAEYWQEPGLPWLTVEQMHSDQMPPDRQGHKAILCVGYMGTNSMAPRFPKNCGVQTMPVFEKQNLVVGRVYTYRHRHSETDEWCSEMARLVKIGSNYLEVKADNHPTPSRWLLRDDEREAVWDVREVTHYVSYPDEEQQRADAASDEPQQQQQQQ